MKVKIVDEKEDVKEMTIEELSSNPYVGMSWNGIKHQLIKSHNGKWGLFAYDGGLCGWSSCSITKLDAIKVTKSDYYAWYVFDTARELYLWMATKRVTSKPTASG